MLTITLGQFLIPFSIATHPIALPAIATNQLKRLFWNVLDDGCDKFDLRKYLEVLLVHPMHHLRVIENGVGFLVELQFFQGESIANNILRKVFNPLLVFWFYSNLIMHVEAGDMLPAY